MQTSGSTTRQRPNVILVLADDLGYSDLGCYGGEIDTPNLDRLARRGVRASAFYNTARCSPSRASLLTGVDPHTAGVGILTEPLAPYGGYPGFLDPGIPTIAERLKAEGYATCLSGKWHLSNEPVSADDSWPTRRGFDEFYGLMPGADSYFHPRNLWHNETRLPIPESDFYITDAISDHASAFVASQGDHPFFLYLAYTAPHWPLHAAEADIERYTERYIAGWDELRESRYRRLLREGLIGEDTALTDRDYREPAWDDAPDKEWEARRMATYAAMVERMDAGIGRVLDAVEAAGKTEDTFVIFLSDNGGAAESVPPDATPHFFRRQPSHTPSGQPMAIGNDPSILPGAPSTYTSYGRRWANVSNTPFRLYKVWVHEGGISSPFIASWPAGGVSGGRIVHDAFQLTDVMPTITQAVSAAFEGRGTSMLPAVRDGKATDHPLFWEHVGHGAMREGQWKLVREADGPWELYDMRTDRAEQFDLAGANPDLVQRMATDWQAWADAAGVIPWDRLKEVVAVHGG